jgi:hypothetical protein
MEILISGFLFWIHLDVVDIDLKFLVQSFLSKSMANSYIKFLAQNVLLKSRANSYI